MFGYKNKPSFVLAYFAKGLVQACEQNVVLGTLRFMSEPQREERRGIF